jgi:tetratricopeptide (TPR) repeat protein
MDVFEWDHVVGVHPLSRSDAASMTTDLLESNPDQSWDEQLVAAIAALAGGHPYFIELLTADWVANGPQSLAALTASGGESTSWEPTQTIRTAFTRHYSDLTDDARTTLEIVAIAGRSTTAAEIAELGGLPLAAINRAILDAMSIGILGADGDAVHFNNDAHRAFVYHTTSDDTKRYHHARLGRSLRAAKSGDKTAQLEAAYHFVRAAMPKEAHETAKAGAILAIRHGAPREAEKVLRAVTSAWAAPTTDMFLLLAESLNLQGNFSESHKLLGLVREKTKSLTNRATRSRLYAQALVRGRLADRSESKAAVRECLKDAELARRGATLSEALLIAGEFAGASHDIKTLESVRNSAIRISETTEDAASLAASNLTAGFCLLGQGTYAQAYEAFARAARAGEEASKFGGLVRTWNGLGICAYSMGEAAIAHSAYRQAAQLCDQLGDYRLKSNILANHGVSLFDLGEYEEAEKMFSQSLAADKLVPDNPYRIFILCNLAEFYMTLDVMDRAAELVTEAETSAGSSSPIQQAQVAITRADLFLADGSLQQACEMVALAERVTGQDNPSGIPLTVHGFDRPAWVRLSYFRRWHEARNPPVAFDPMAISTGPLPLALLVELLIFQEWLGEQCGATWSTPMTAQQTVHASGLVGVVEKMRRVRMLPSALAEPTVATVRREPLMRGE